MASLAPRPSLFRWLFEPLSGAPLVAGGIAVWLAGATYCHGYQWLLAREETGPWSGSLIWSAVAVVPWFALFEWSKQQQGADALRRPALLIALVVGIAGFSIALEYLVNFCVGDMSDHLALLVMRRMPAIGVTVLLLALTRKAMLRQPPDPAAIPLSEIAGAIDWVAAADNYVELHSDGRVQLRRMTMARADSLLRRHGFVRIHRRYLINRSRIAEVADKTVRMQNGHRLPIGTAFASNLR
ncbi:MAG TPA: LytTR family DNA-binding domain-containing protein [Sphingomicrobium sp.]|nr:LytTR family DNA-binding domain-containing protein [Sphingomicrobium sp.]